MGAKSYRRSRVHTKTAPTKRNEIQTWIEDVKGVESPKKFTGFGVDEPSNSRGYVATLNISEGEVGSGSFLFFLWLPH